MTKVNNEKQFLTLKQIIKEASTRPKPVHLFKGITEKSFGLLIGASKGGKTVFAENLAMHYACRRKEFLGHKLGGAKGRILFLGLEEFWLERSRRNANQIATFTEDEQKLIGENYLYQEIDFINRVTKPKHWTRVETLVRKSEAKLVIIDSVTRLNHGNLEDSKTAEVIMYNLRNICHRNGITLICIHHTPKMVDQVMTIDKIKGSSTFAQEADFALGIGKTSKGDRYLKDIFYRYSAEDSETAQEFEIDNNAIIKHITDTTEREILNRSDARRELRSHQLILDFFNKESCKEYPTVELISILSPMLSLKERRIKSLLSEMVKENKIRRISNGVYASIDCQGKEAGDEEE